MIARLLRLARWTLIYGCLATVIAQLIILTYLAGSWRPDHTRLVQILAIAQGIDLFDLKAEADREADPPTQEQVSFEQIVQARAIGVHYLELREQSLRDGLDQLAYQQQKLTQEKEQFSQVRESFDAKLLAMQEGVIAQGTEKVRLQLESIKPKQAKELLANMLSDEELDEVVLLLGEMPAQKCAKIMAEFKTAEEIEQLNEILRKIREGYPDFKLAADTRKALQHPGPPGS